MLARRIHDWKERANTGSVKEFNYVIRVTKTSLHFHEKYPARIRLAAPIHEQITTIKSSHQR